MLDSLHATSSRAVTTKASAFFLDSVPRTSLTFSCQLLPIVIRTDQHRKGQQLNINTDGSITNDSGTENLLPAYIANGSRENTGHQNQHTVCTTQNISYNR